MAIFPTDTDLARLAADVGRALERDALALATAESCTGGWVGQALTSVAGSSAWFDRGFVTYSDASKTDMLAVSPAVLNQYGAVSEPSARAMAEGALARSDAQVAVAVTGVAGPSGGTPDKPVGTVWFAWAMEGGPTRAERHLFPGDRTSIRRQAVAVALEGLLRLLKPKIYTDEQG